MTDVAQKVIIAPVAHLAPPYEPSDTANLSQSFLNLIGCNITLGLHSGPPVTGLVYTVDPETGSFLLLNGDAMTMVPGASVLQHTVNTTFLHSVNHSELPQGDLEGLDTLDHTLEGLDTIDHTLFKLLAVHKLNTNECAARRAELLEFVKLHRLPVREEGSDVIIANVVTCQPPFTKDSCYSTNDIILDRVQRILNKMS